MNQVTYDAVVSVLLNEGRRRAVTKEGYYTTDDITSLIDPYSYEFTLGYSSLSTVSTIALRMKAKGFSGNQHKIKEILTILIGTELVKEKRVSALNGIHTTYIPTDLFYLLIK